MGDRKEGASRPGSVTQTFPLTLISQPCQLTSPEGNSPHTPSHLKISCESCSATVSLPSHICRHLLTPGDSSRAHPGSRKPIDPGCLPEPPSPPLGLPNACGFLRAHPSPRRLLKEMTVRGLALKQNRKVLSSWEHCRDAAPKCRLNGIQETFTGC